MTLYVLNGMRSCLICGLIEDTVILMFHKNIYGIFLLRIGKRCRYKIANKWKRYKKIDFIMMIYRFSEYFKP